ncbi:type III glutamate--ammonia ligase [Rubrivivax gelatinosus]|uniref:Glutamine synthetase n=1 Tax=Rubrivivax gelatinosus TaxID=28068 RepID=A0A4R2MCV8_RUBGE|nr:type III glutamate--ammonia ligase [Rubrivivax gelatinosus]MBK1686368.1 type III glutamate--ammonia ligase [Rubrivivax gelatinosus]TCP04410.1 glutamine synthetase [Rubrivivax gelatinosus]
MKPLHERLEAVGVHTLLVQFTDVHGVAKGKLVPLAHLDEVLATGAGFAGPSIWGTALPRCGPRSEYYARGDAATALPLPWWPGVARLVGDGFVAGEPFDGCPRQVLRRARERLAAHGLTMQTGIEPEFFLLKRDDAGRWLPADDADRLDKPSYDLKSLPRHHGFLHALSCALADAGLDVLQIDHEDAHGQYEVNFAHDEALASCDHLMLFKLAAHALAEERGLVFSMMPKPFADQPGSGLHFHVSLWRGAELAAEMLPAFIAGVLAHAPALAALAAPTVNSYKRLTVGESLSGTTWAPACIAHGPNNRTALVRTLSGRFEWRLPDASANPYLATAALIAAGLDGLERGLVPPPAVDDDLFALDLATMRARGIGLLPQSLAEALDALAADPVVLGALGPTLGPEFLRLKRAEWTEYARHVSGWELERYAAVF